MMMQISPMLVLMCFDLVWLTFIASRFRMKSVDEALGILLHLVKQQLCRLPTNPEGPSALELRTSSDMLCVVLLGLGGSTYVLFRFSFAILVIVAEAHRSFLLLW